MRINKIVISTFSFIFIALALLNKWTNFIAKNQVILMFILILVTNVLTVLITKKKNLKNDILDLITFTSNSIIILLIIMNFFIFTRKVTGQSMSPTIKDGERLYVNKFLINVKVDDIIVYKTETDYIIKRVVALEGDEISLFVETTDDVDHYFLVVNNELVTSYEVRFEILIVDKLYHLLKDGSYTLKTNELIILGDNANNSNDSRQMGIVEYKNIVGKRIGKS